MAWYRCLVRGENFPILIDDKRAPTGFYTTRYVEVGSEDEAEPLVIELLRTEAVLQVPPDTPGMEKAQVFFEEIVEVEGPGTPNAGFTFFRE